jgi:small subunit ribosomal protein S3
MANRIAQLIERGTAFRRAALWTINTIMEAGALGVEVTIAGKLRSERAHFEKHTNGIIPKSGDIAEKVVKVSTSEVLTKMGLMGIRLKIAMKEDLPREFELTEDELTEISPHSETGQQGTPTDDEAAVKLDHDVPTGQSIEKVEPSSAAPSEPVENKNETGSKKAENVTEDKSTPEVS